jgi:hypothetical protein
MKMSTAHSLAQLRNFRILFIALSHLGSSHNGPKAHANKYHPENRISRGRVSNDALEATIPNEAQAPNDEGGQYLVGDMGEGRFQVSHNGVIYTTSSPLST